MEGLKEEKVRAIFSLAGLEIIAIWELPNGYWPRPQFEEDRPHEYINLMRLREASPWWLVNTQLGLIKIGTRKRVISIDWSATDLRCEVTKNDVTKSPVMVHAWTELDAARYLKALLRCFKWKTEGTCDTEVLEGTSER